MPINLPGIPIQPVPIGQVPGVIPQIPPHVDPSSIIMQAAQLRQQRDLAQQEMQQKSLESLISNVQSAAALAEHKREAMVNEQNAAMILGLKEQTTPVELEHIKAQTALAQAQADMMANGGYGAILDNPNIPPSMKMEMFSNRNGLRASVWNQYLKDHPNANLAQAQQAYEQGIAGARTAGGTAVQIPTAMAQAFDTMKSKLLPLAQKAGFGDYPTANATRLWVHKHVKSDPDIANYDTAISETARQLAQVFSANGVPVEYSQKAASDILHTDMGVSGLQAISSQTLPDIVSSRIGGLSSIGVQTKSTTQSGQGMIRVRQKSTGQVGSIPSNEFDATQYEAL